ncbi:hypothetical protein [Ensifer canadensis]
MQTFFHDGPGRVADCLRDGWSLYVCDVDGAWQRPVDFSFIEIYYKRTLSLWGGYPTEYILAVEQSPPSLTRLIDVFDGLESGTADVILLVGYNDGGLFSISNRHVSFHEGAELAPWWQPFDGRYRDKHS